MAVFLLKASFGSSYAPPSCAGTVFADVPCVGGAFDSWIEDLAGRGITGGCGSGNYCPGNANTRGQMAVFLTRPSVWSCTGRNGPLEAQRAVELEKGGVERAVVRVNEAEVNLPLVAQAGPVERHTVALEQSHVNAAGRELQSHAGSLQAGSQNENSGLEIDHEGVSPGFYPRTLGGLRSTREVPEGDPELRRRPRSRRHRREKEEAPRTRSPRERERTGRAPWRIRPARGRRLRRRRRDSGSRRGPRPRFRTTPT